jgi:PAS domain S-box-containing protein
MAAWEQAVRREELAVTLFEESGDALFLFDPDTEVLIDVNPMAERLSGFPCRELLRRPVTYLFRSAAPAGLSRLRTAFKATGQFHAQDDFLLRHRQDGVWVPVNVTATRLHARPKTLGLITARDVSERRRLEEESLRLAAIVQSSEDAVIGESLDGTILSWNPAAEWLYGYTAAEAVGRDLFFLVPPDAERRLRDVMERVRRGEHVPPSDELRRRKDGQFVPVSVSRSAIRDRDGRVVGTAAFHRSIRDRLRLEEEVRQAQKMEAVGQLAGGVAHDFNNLLTVINGYASLLLGMPDLGAAARSFVEEIHKAGERSAALTAQLLAFSRRQVLEPKVVNLNDRVRGVVTMLRRLIGEDVALTTRLDPDLGHVKADPGQLEQVLINLAVNARDAMPAGGRLTIETANVDLDEAEAERRPEVRPGRYVQLTVGDTGVGMDDATKAHIFEPFFTTKGPGKGTGLGLAVVHGVVAQSGGHVVVVSAVGRGSTFRIYLPRLEQPWEAGAPEPRAEAAPRGAEIVLLVEDEDGVRHLARRTLEMAGYTVLEAAHGGEGVRVAERHAGPIHLLVSDVVMPEMGGRLLAERLAAARPGLKVLFLSGYTDDAVVRHGVFGSEVNFLQKPFTPAGLARKVREALDN